jgi:MoxR-like ATPase
VTVAGQTRPLDAPFLVLATQNPIELEGTYPLPEAQLDRFLLNPVIQYLSTEDEIKMVSETTGIDREEPQPVLGAEDILTLQSLVRQVPAPENVVAYAVALVTATRPQADSCDEWTSKRVKWGAGSRGAQALILAAKARALLDGRANASSEDVKLMAKSALRHRVLPSFFAESEGLGADEIVDHLLETISA